MPKFALFTPIVIRGGISEMSRKNIGQSSTLPLQCVFQISDTSLFFKSRAHQPWLGSKLEVKFLTSHPSVKISGAVSEMSAPTNKIPLTYGALQGLHCIVCIIFRVGPRILLIGRRSAVWRLED